MSKTVRKVEIILSPINRLFAKLAMVKAVGIRAALAYRGPTFIDPPKASTYPAGAYVVEYENSKYYYPLTSISRIKVWDEVQA